MKQLITFETRKEVFDFDYQESCDFIFIFNFKLHYLSNIKLQYLDQLNSIW